ncbi:hypothetical protein SERN_1766 [Serinibacter arcticus]|uniref:Uncharacterized protein n=1 Tax=Serinibacter arcticus TaxID=1655435 RepID=A0A4Z1E4R4_9MICO|nr:hypothetical protein SERN_1766 [Serinibacter arcticus]
MVAASALVAPLLIPVAAAADVPGPVLHYEFEADQISGDTIQDLSPSNLDGRIVNASALEDREGREPGTAALGLTGGAADAAAPYVEIPGGLFTDLSEVTISTWVEWDGGPDFQWVYGLGKDASSATFLTPSFQGQATARSSIKPVNGGAEVGAASSAKLPTDTWVNAVTVIDGDVLSFYVNGVLVNQQAATADVASILNDPTGRTSGFLGRSFWSHPFFDGAIDDVRVYDAALTADQVVEVFGGEVADLESVAPSSFQVATTTGVAPALPATATGTFSDGLTRPVPITWQPVDPARYQNAGTFTVEGSVEGLDTVLTATVTVRTAGALTIDVGESTGPFHGGASGTLYGLYDEGLPSNNLIDAINLKTVATKAQDGPQHPGADALEIVKGLADSSDGDVYIYMTDIHRGFPYQWPGDSPQEKLDIYMDKLAVQVDQVLALPEEYQDNVVFMPYNEPEGNMFGDGEWSYNRVNWLNDPTDFFAAWDRAYELIKGKMPDARIGGPNTSILYDQVHGFFEHAVEAGTVPDVTAWHELSNPATIRSSVDRYRGWEREIFVGTPYEGTELPINITEYAFNYHTSVPGQMVQWISALEDSKVYGDIAYWNIDGNLSDSAVQANRANGQWWLLNAYAQMTGDTVQVTPPQPDVSYTLQGVATRDDAKSQVRALFGGAGGNTLVDFQNVPADLFGGTAHAVVQEISWSGQIGDSANPPVVAELDVPVVDGAVQLGFGSADLPTLDAESAYLVILTPGENSSATSVAPTLFEGSYEAESAGFSGSPRFVNGPEGSPQDVGKFYTSGGYNVGGLRTGSSLALDFEVDVPQDGTYDLSVFASSLNTFESVAEQGPTNVFLTVDGGQEQEIFLPLGYKWVVWDQARTAVDLTAGAHTITLSARSASGDGATKGDALIDKIDLSLANPDFTASYEAENALLDGSSATYDVAGLSGSGGATVGVGESVTFWVHSARDEAATLLLDRSGGAVDVAVNGQAVGSQDETVAFLSGGINKVEVTGAAGESVIDRLRVVPDADLLASTTYQAEDAVLAGTAQVTPLSLAEGGEVVTRVGGAPDNDSTLTFDAVEVEEAGTYAVTVRYSNEEQSPATHYNPDPLGRYAYVTVNGGEEQRVLFPHSFHENNFWELTFLAELDAGTNELAFASREKTNFDGVTYASQTWPGILLRSQWAPNMDSVRVTPFTGPAGEEPQPEVPFVDVPEGSLFFEEIAWLASAGISTGWELPDGSFEFRPVTPIARDAMAAFLYREAGSPDFTAPTTSPFSDVDVSNQFYKEIAWLAEEKISTGWVQADGTAQFRPLEPIARDAMAAFLHRAAGSPAVELPAVSPFDDVTPATQFYAEISWMYEQEITTGWTGNDGTRIYRPLSPVNRDAMAAFLYRFHHNLG